MDGGAVAGNGKVLFRYEAAFHGRQDGDMIEELLQEPLKVKRDILPGHEAFFDRFGDFGFCFLGFLFFSFRLIRPFVVPGSGKEFIAAIQVRFGCSPEPVHEVKIGTERRQGIRVAADEGGKDTVTFEPFHPKGKGQLGQTF